MKAYDLWLRVFDALEPRFRPEIPSKALELGKPFELDLRLVRFRGKRLSVAQVDEILDAQPEHQDTVFRMAVKNYLVSLKLMETGELGPNRSWLQKDSQLWKGGRPLGQARVEQWVKQGGWMQFGYRKLRRVFERVESHLKKLRWQGKAV